MFVVKRLTLVYLSANPSAVCWSCWSDATNTVLGVIERWWKELRDGGKNYENSLIENERRNIAVALPALGRMLTSRSLFISGRSQLLKQNCVVDLDNVMWRTWNNNDLCFCEFELYKACNNSSPDMLEQCCQPACVAWMINGIELIQSRDNSGERGRHVHLQICRLTCRCIFRRYRR